MRSWTGTVHSTQLLKNSLRRTGPSGCLAAGSPAPPESELELRRLLSLLALEDFFLSLSLSLSLCLLLRLESLCLLTLPCFVLGTWLLRWLMPPDSRAALSESSWALYSRIALSSSSASACLQPSNQPVHWLLTCLGREGHPEACAHCSMWHCVLQSVHSRIYFIRDFLSSSAAAPLRLDAGMHLRLFICSFAVCMQLLRLPGGFCGFLLLLPVLEGQPLHLQGCYACGMPFCCMEADVCAKFPVPTSCPSVASLVTMPGPLCLLVLLILPHLHTSQSGVLRTALLACCTAKNKALVYEMRSAALG